MTPDWLQALQRCKLSGPAQQVHKAAGQGQLSPGAMHSAQLPAAFIAGPDARWELCAGSPVRLQAFLCVTLNYAVQHWEG